MYKKKKRVRKRFTVSQGVCFRNAVKANLSLPLPKFSSDRTAQRDATCGCVRSAYGNTTRAPGLDLHFCPRFPSTMPALMMEQLGNGDEEDQSARHTPRQADLLPQLNILWHLYLEQHGRQSDTRRWLTGDARWRNRLLGSVRGRISAWSAGPLISKTCLSRSTGQGLEIPLEDLQIVPVPHRPACVGMISGEAGSGCKGPYPPEPCKL